MESLYRVDAEFQYTCQYIDKVYALVFMNTLSVPSMHNNLMFPLTMIEAGLVVNDTKNILTM